MKDIAKIKQFIHKGALMSYSLPDDKGHFEQYGGVFIAETLMTAVTELKEVL
jgi:tryptophan synthase, beta chain (EC 4.2.1.20)